MIIFSVDEMVISDGDGQTDWLSFSNDVHGLPSVSARMAGRSGRHPALAGIERAGRQFSVLSYFPSDATATSKNALLAWLASGETRRVVGVDAPIPGVAADSVLAWFGPWDIYNGAGTWTIRGILDASNELALAGTWALSPAGGLSIQPADGAATIDNPLSMTAGTVALWWTPDVNQAGVTRYFFDEGNLSAYFDAADDKIYFTDGTNAAGTAELTFAADTRMHLAFAWSTAGLAIYRNGASAGTNATYTGPTAGATLYVGCDTASANQIDGIIESLLMLDCALSAADMLTVYNTGASGINPRWINAACLDSKPMTHNGTVTDIGLTSLFQVDGDVAWRQRDGDYYEWAITNSGATQTKSVNNRGNLPAFPQIRITPRTARTSGFTKMRWVAVEWTTPNAATRYPVDLSNGGIDLSADAQADGDDIRVYVDGYEVDRWLDGTLVSDVLIWANLDFDAGADLTLNGAISDSVTSLKINEDISDLPETGTLYVGTEAIAYTERNARTRVISGLARGVNGTSAAAHSDDDDIYWIQHDIRIYYGDAALSAPTADDNYKPMFELDASENDSWVYEEFGEGDGLRAGQWTTNGAFGGTGRGAYTANHGTDADPWEEIGWETDQPNYGIVYLHQPCGVSKAIFTNGEAYYNIVAGSNSHDIGVASSANEFSTYAKDYTHSFSAEDTWEAWSTTQTYITLMPYVGIYAYANYEEVWIEAADCTIEVFKPPVPVVGAAQDAYELACTIANTTTGESIALSLSMVLDDTLIVDTDARSVVDGDGAGRLSSRTLSSVRTEWLQLKPGANTLTYTEAGVVEVDVELLWDTRSTL